MYITKKAHRWIWLLIVMLLGGCDTVPEPGPVLTETATIQSEINNKQSSPAIIVREQLGLALWELETATHKIISERNDEFIMWDETGCAMIVDDWGGDLYKMDLSGNIIEKIFSFNPLKQKDPNIPGYQVILSPSMDWVAYWIGRGQPTNQIVEHPEYEIQDIRTISLDLKDGPYHITRGGVGWQLAWSPDGQKLAFSDYDDHHILQAFVATRTGEQRKQITAFDKKVLSIARIVWSKDGNNLAIGTSTEGKAIVSYFANDQYKIIEDPDSLYLIKWIDDETLLLINDIETWIIYNIMTGESTETPIDHKFQVGPQQFQTSEKIGYFGENSDFIIYDIINDTYKRYPNIQPDFFTGGFLNWSAVPYAYETGNCR